MQPTPLEYRGGLARVALRQVRALDCGDRILRATAIESVRAIEECSAFGWLPAAPYHALLRATRAELSDERHRAFWSAWVEPFLRMPLLTMTFDSILQVAGLGPGALVGLIPRMRQMTIRGTGVLTVTVDQEDSAGQGGAVARCSETPLEFWIDGIQIDAMAGIFQGAFDLSGVKGTVGLIEDTRLAAPERVTMGFRLTWQRPA